jgi:glucosamine--fructose-6-phosphate aminotransferase (isomerizing)
MDAFKRLQGCYALLAISPDARRLVAFRKDLPLVVGVAEGGIIFASDASVLLQWTPKMIYLQNNDVAVACKKELVLRNLIDGEEE